jgi:chromate reductase
MMLRILALSGSLWRESRNVSALDATALLVPQGTSIARHMGLAALPIFNPDQDGEDAPQSVKEFRRSSPGTTLHSPYVI